MPDSFDEHNKVMFDLQVLAFVADVTRVSRVYPESGVRSPFHGLSHHGENPDKIAEFARLNLYHVSKVAYFLDKLKNTPDGDGNLLDHSVVLYGSPMGDSHVHEHKTARGMKTLLVCTEAGEQFRADFNPFAATIGRRHQGALISGKLCPSHLEGFASPARLPSDRQCRYARRARTGRKGARGSLQSGAGRVRNLLEYSTLNTAAEKLGVQAIDRRQRLLNVKFHRETHIDPARLVNVVSRTRGAQFTPASVLILPLDAAAAGEVLQFPKERLEQLQP